MLPVAGKLQPLSLRNDKTAVPLSGVTNIVFGMGNDYPSPCFWW